MKTQTFQAERTVYYQVDKGAPMAVQLIFYGRRRCESYFTVGGAAAVSAGVTSWDEIRDDARMLARRIR